MKAKPNRILWTGAMLSILLLGVGLAQADPTPPICSPNYTVDAAASSVILTANCAPEPGKSINFGDGYSWTRTAATPPSGVAGTASVLSGLTAGQITQSAANADGATYAVQAMHSDGAGFGSSSSVKVKFASPDCSLNIQKAGAAPGASVNVAPGNPVTLLPACLGANSLDWYSAADSAPYSHIIAPPGGVVFPLAALTKYYVVGINEYGDSASNTVTATTAPPLTGCAITSPSASRTVGYLTGSTFTASCTGGTPTSFAWTLTGSSVGSNSSTYTTATGLGVGTYPVAVSINNGASTPPTTQFIVSSVALSNCTISSTSPSFSITEGATQTLTATCTNSPNSSQYAWTVGGSSVGGSGNIYTTASNLAVGTYPVTVTATNAGGVGPAASTTLTVSALSAPSCTVSPSNQTISTGSTQQFSANCNPAAATTYAWSLNGNPVGANSISYTTASNLAAGQYTVSVTPSNTGGTGAVASATLTVNTALAGGGAADCNNPPLDVAVTNAINTSLVPNGPSQAIHLNRGQAVSFPLGSSVARAGDFSVEYPAAFNAVTPYKYATISSKSCDFSYTYFDVPKSCAATVMNGGVLSYAFAAPGAAPIANTCMLEIGKQYYINFRNEYVKLGTRSGDQRGKDSCPAGSSCGFQIMLH